VHRLDLEHLEDEEIQRALDQIGLRLAQLGFPRRLVLVRRVPLDGRE
jgi:hypothetical protein